MTDFFTDRAHLTSGDMGEVDVFPLAPINDHEGRGVAIVHGDLTEMSEQPEGPLVRMHSACIYGEVFESRECDCGHQFRSAKQQIYDVGSGILFYLDQEGRGAGLVAKAKAYRLKAEEGLDTAEAYERMGIPYDSREYGHCARFLVEHSITRVQLLSNNPTKIKALESHGIAVVRRPLVVGINASSADYLRTKRDKAGHLLPEDL